LSAFFASKSVKLEKHFFTVFLLSQHKNSIFIVFMQVDYPRTPKICRAGAYAQVMPAGRPTQKERSPIGKRISEAREAIGLSQAELGAKLGVSQQVVAAWERKLTGIHSDNLGKISEALNVSADALLGLEPITRSAGHTTEQRLRKVFAQLEYLPQKDRKQVVDLIHSLSEKEKLKTRISS